MGITESWLDDNISNSEIQLSDYNIFHIDRSGSRGGGVLPYVHKSLKCIPCKRFEAVNRDESFWCLVTLPMNATLLIGLIYRSPTSTETFNSKILEIIQDISNQHDFTQLLIMGNFNFPEINLENLYYSCSSTSLPAKFLDALQDSFLTQFTPTSAGPTVIYSRFNNK